MFKITMQITLKQKFYKKVYLQLVRLDVLFRSFFIEVKSKQAEDDIGCPGGKKRRKISFGGKNQGEPAEQYIEYADYYTNCQVNAAASPYFTGSQYNANNG